MWIDIQQPFKLLKQKVQNTYIFANVNFEIELWQIFV